MCPRRKLPFLCEVKIDGVALDLVYRDGRLVQRGDPGRQPDR